MIWAWAFLCADFKVFLLAICLFIFSFLLESILLCLSRNLSISCMLSNVFIKLLLLIYNSFNMIKNSTHCTSFMIFSHFINCLGWHWLTQLYRSQVHNSTTHHLYAVLCVHHPKSSLHPSPFIPPIPLYSLTLLLSLSHTHTHTPLSFCN